jgi:UDP-N-acetylmuramoyl-tripeptide--D-alanyl-D-alanine ligase
VSIAALALAGAGLIALLSGRLHRVMHLFQLEHYEPARLRLWIAKRGDRVAGAELAGIAVAGGLVAVALALGDAPALAVAVLVLVAALVAARRAWGREQIKPLSITKRVRRLFVVGLAPVALAVAVICALDAGGAEPAAMAVALTAVGLAAHLFAPELLIAADRALKPVQQLDNRRFIRRARRRLEEVDPLVIGITGSYGKTTTKACTAEVAQLRGPSYPTPASFNSYLGVVRAVNEGLEDDHRSFVVEMGAYRRGDIAELCELVRPRVGIVTAVGPAHLERFGSLDETERAKGELAEALPAEGALVTRADDERCLRIAGRTEARVRLFAPQPTPGAEVWASDISLGEGRTRFLLRAQGENGVEQAAVKSRLLGRHNVANLLAAAAVGIELGLPLDGIARALGRVAPPDHRLAPIVNAAAGVIVIDDAYNANPEGAAAALEVLEAHPAERRLLVTPGMVELGEAESAENERFGARAAAVCDIVVLVGDSQTIDVRRGLTESGFPDDSLHVVADAKEAEALLATMTRRGDLVLFENDLPDLYSAASMTGQPTR